MSKNPDLSYGIRKYIRREKAQVRRQTIDPREQEQRIANLYRQVTGR